RSFGRSGDHTQCLELGLDRILVTCDASNQASRRIIEANGGEYHDSVNLEDRPVATSRFWIDVRAQCRSAVNDVSDGER
ncbi:MAG TPA: hypothetical protein VEZ15_04835, partial [Acidimicrobiia bacterium]|nr:hypothetical protein [Acidimicrobiia bacterium]